MCRLPSTLAARVSVVNTAEVDDDSVTRMTPEQFARRAEAEWSTWWRTQFDAVAAAESWVRVSIPADRTYPTLNVYTRAGTIRLYERCADMLNTDWPHGHVGRLWVELIDDQLIYHCSPDGSYAWGLTPTPYFQEMVEAISELCTWGGSFSARAVLRRRWRDLTTRIGWWREDLSELLRRK